MPLRAAAGGYDLSGEVLVRARFPEREMDDVADGERHVTVHQLREHLARR